MQQVLYNMRHDHLISAHVPTLNHSRQHDLLVVTQTSLISAGTERMLLEFGQGNFMAKARSQPEKVRQVLDKVNTDGLVPTIEAIFNKLDQPLPLGYCNAGVVQEVGNDISNFEIGNRVVSNGPHAEVVSVAQNLCARIPDNVSDDEAAFTVLGAVALQGVRLLNPALGESIVVSGLGLLGLIAVQMLVANGCQVLGIDFNQQRLALARRFGAQTVDLSTGGDPVAAAMAFANGRGVDGVLITASTKSSDPVHQAAQMSRKRGRIVLVGVTGLELNRADFYEKELTFQVSCSYGPGRYDPQYEEKGQDYPFGFVRWTAQRNFEAVLQLMADGKLDVKPLISHRVPIEEAPRAYQLLTEDKSALGILLTYSGQPDLARTVAITPAKASIAKAESKVTIGMIGAGNFAMATLLPALKKANVPLRTIASASGTSAAIAARKYGFAQATSDYQTILADPLINTVLITTRHGSHARMVVEALAAGKHVFVEKPLALNQHELVMIQQAVASAPEQQLLVGFNRRFAPLAQQMKQLLQARSEPMSMIYTVNAGTIPADHWVHDAASGGGRIIGEGCHFIDFLAFLADSPITGVEARMMGRAAGLAVQEDKMTILLDFADGSTGVVHYFANGSKRFPKERVEVFNQGRVLVLDNFRRLQGYGWPRFRNQWLWQQDKGHAAELQAFLERIRTGGSWLIPWTTLEQVTLATFMAVERAQAAPRGISVVPCTDSER
jgi:predicted dehydrogenase/threonine dehydrogenase-like Zn-dependent dehydrogenase